jgi:hypothetical protein
MTQLPLAARPKQQRNRVPGRQQGVRQIAADKSGPTDDRYPHLILPL